MHLALWFVLSSLKLARMFALSFWMTALSSAMVFAARTLRMNCLTVGVAGRSVAAAPLSLHSVPFSVAHNNQHRKTADYSREVMMRWSWPARGPGGGF